MKAVVKLSHLVLLLWVCGNLDRVASTGPLYGESFRSTFDNRGDTLVFPTSVNEGSPSYFSDNLNFDAIDGKILIGAADKLYVLSKNLEVAEGGEYSWNSSRKCIQADERKCRNHIRIYQHPNTGDPNSLFVCGTQSGIQPQCRMLTVNGSRLIETGVPNPTRLISPHPDFPGFGDFRKRTPSDDVYLSANFKTKEATSFDLSFQSVAINSTGESVTTSRLYGWQEGDQYWMQSPVVFVDFERLDYATQLNEDPQLLQFYFIFIRERQVPASTTGDTNIISRVIRLCRNDRNVSRDPQIRYTPPSDAQDTIFTSFMKARIFCEKEIPPGAQFIGGQDFKYNEMWSVAFNNITGGRYHENTDYLRIVYGAFSGPRIGPTGTAICAYRATEIFDVFRDDVVDPRTSVEHENDYLVCRPEGRTAEGSQRINAVQSVRQIAEDPLLIMEGFYVTQMVVDQVCVVKRDMSACLNQDVLFLGTSDGRILKVVFASNGAGGSDDFNPVVAEEITLGSSDRVKEMKIESTGSTKHLYVVTEVRVYRLPLERCSRHQNITSCVGSRDPYCVWDSQQSGGCVTSSLSADGRQQGSIPVYQRQNIHTGIVQLPEVGFEMDSYTAVEGSNSRLSVTIVSNEQVPRGVVQVNITDLTAKVGVNVFSSNNPISVSLEGARPPYRMSFDIEARRDGQFFGRNLQFQLSLQNTQLGAVVFTQQNATVTIEDVDGTLFRIGLADLGTVCAFWQTDNNFAKMLSMKIAAVIGGGYPIDNVVNTTFICARPDDKYITFTGALLATSSLSTSQLLNAVQKWVEETPEIEYRNSITNNVIVVTVDNTCSVRISTPNSACDAKETNTGGLSSELGSDSDATISGLAAGFVTVTVVACCLFVVIGVLVFALLKTKKNGSFSPSENARVTPHEDRKRDSVIEPYEAPILLTHSGGLADRRGSKDLHLDMPEFKSVLSSDLNPRSSDPLLGKKFFTESVEADSSSLGHYETVHDGGAEEKPTSEHGPSNGIQKHTFVEIDNKIDVETSGQVHTTEQQV